MFRCFYPHLDVDDVYTFDFESAYRDGVRGLIFDVDNTLVPHGAPADARAVQLFERLRACGFQTMLLSNNKEPRVKPFAEAVGSGYIYLAGKPGRKSYRQAMRQMGTTPETTLFLGDQLFTDVWGAKRTDITSVLVKPIHPKEEIQIVLKRVLEKVVLYFYYKEKKRKTE
jgi:HAD superfamily phosphatase (TIGR01668 family)